MLHTNKVQKDVPGVQAMLAIADKDDEQKLSGAFSRQGH